MRDGGDGRNTPKAREFLQGRLDPGFDAFEIEPRVPAGRMGLIGARPTREAFPGPAPERHFGVGLANVEHKAAAVFHGLLDLF